MNATRNATIAAIAAITIFAGCRVVEVENKGEEVARDGDGQPVLLKDGSIQTVKKGWSVYHNQHWMWTQADSITAGIKKEEVNFAMNGLNTAPSSNLVALVDTSLTGAANLAAKVGAAIASSGGTTAAEAVAGWVSKFIAAGGNADKATVSCKDGSCTITDGNVTCVDGNCSETGAASANAIWTSTAK